MVTAHKLADESVRRPASLSAMDARLSVWGQMCREAVVARAQALVNGAVLYVERKGRSAAQVHQHGADASDALLAISIEPLVVAAEGLLPEAIPQSCRLLWVDPERLEERLQDAIEPAVDRAKLKIRRRQALFRRRARLAESDPHRLEVLREEIESLRVPKCPRPEEVRAALEKRASEPPPPVLAVSVPT